MGTMYILYLSSVQPILHITTRNLTCSLQTKAFRNFKLGAGFEPTTFRLHV